jgi:hypothetical protein
MFFKHRIIKLLFFMMAISSSLVGFEPVYRPLVDYVKRNRKEVALGIGAATALGSLYYAYRLSHPDVNMNQALGPQGLQLPVINVQAMRFSEPENRVFSAENKVLVGIYNTLGDIKVKTYPGPFIIVHVEKRAELEADLNNIDTEFDNVGDRLIITATKRRNNINGLVNYTVLLPEDKQIFLTAQTNYGHVDARNIKSQVGVHTNYGDVRLDNISGNAIIESLRGSIAAANVAGSLKASTQNANIIVQNINDADLVADQGNIQASSVKGVFKASANMGNVLLDQDIIDKKVYINAEKGNIKVSARAVQGAINTQADMGIIQSDFAFNNNADVPALVTLRALMGTITIHRK